MIRTVSGICSVDLFQQLDAGHPGHALIGDHDRNRLILFEDRSAPSSDRTSSDVIEIHERESHRLEDGFLVVDDQNSWSNGFGHWFPRL